jgi:hypothetical protein
MITVTPASIADINIKECDPLYRKDAYDHVKKTIMFYGGGWFKEHPKFTNTLIAVLIVLVVIGIIAAFIYWKFGDEIKGYIEWKEMQKSDEWEEWKEYKLEQTLKQY